MGLFFLRAGFLGAPFLAEPAFLVAAFFVLEGSLGMVDLENWMVKIQIIPKERQQINSVITLYCGTF